jgi:phage baseplate assembly protein W
MKLSDKTFLGTGWAFPPEFDNNSQSNKMVSEDEDIRQSLFIILSTRPGERMMLPDFGCGINEMAFETMDRANMTYAKNLIETAFLRYETRITVNDIEFETAEEIDGILYINIDYTVRTTNTRSNMVYPFYLKEGTNIRL